MAAVSEEERSVLQHHIPKGESLLSSFTGEKHTIALTDRRLMEVFHAVDEQGQDTSVKSTCLTTDYIVGTEYERGEESSAPDADYIIGGIVAFVGLIMIAMGLNGSMGLVFAGLVVAALGGAILYVSEEEKTGEVKITLIRTGDLSNLTWTSPRGETEVP